MPYAYQRGDNCAGRGDYYRGDYYRGDPGFSLGGVLRTIGKAAGGFITGGPLGAATAVVRSFGPNPKAGTALAPLPPPPGGMMGLPISSYPPPGGVVNGGGGGTYGGSMIPTFTPTMCPPGVTIGADGRMRRGHANKSAYVTRGGGTSRWPKALLLHEKGSVCVGPRKMNVANPRALRKAIRRGRGFIKLSRKAAAAFGFTVVSRGRAKGKAVARRR